MGVHEPYCDRRADCHGVCPKCAEQEKLLVFEGSEPTKSNAIAAVNDTMATAHLAGPHIRQEDSVIHGDL